MVQKILIASGVILALTVGAVVLFIGRGLQEAEPINSFEECARAGYPVMESYPRQCRAGDKTFTESSPSVENDMLEQFFSENVRLFTPRINERISSPLVIKGEARGTWFFEASFPVRLVDAEVLDAEENRIAVGYVQATSDWMTENFVPFTGEIVFDTPRGEHGVLILEKDNPSGLPEHADEARIPIRFAVFDPEADELSADGCKRTGCSSQICSKEDVITTCEFRPEYACYRTAQCERQPNGECGWTMNQQLLSCLGEI